MNLQELQSTWNELARKDAMWAVLTGPLASDRAWDAETFFQTGRDEIAFVLGRAEAAGARLQRGRALDFGCGLGRLTQALGDHFAHVDGVDIAGAMIERAQALNRHGTRCSYHLNQQDDLALFPDGTFDFVYSSITLQHIAPAYSRRYITEFFRVLAPGGVVVFQIPAEPVPVPVARSRNTAPLPKHGCRAAIEAPARLRCAPAAPITLRIMVRNEGAITWPAEGETDGRFSIRLGNHWRGRFGWMVRRDDARTQLPHDVAPGQTIQMGLNVVAPSRAGSHVLEFDMVQEHVRWFASVGSKPVRTQVQVDPKMPPGAVEGLPRQMEMHGIPRPDVEALVSNAGGRMFAVEDNDAPGPGWTSYRYIAIR